MFFKIPSNYESMNLCLFSLAKICFLRLFFFFLSQSFANSCGEFTKALIICGLCNLLIERQDEHMRQLAN